jgi:hypothetical protein
LKSLLCHPSLLCWYGTLLPLGINLHLCPSGGTYRWVNFNSSFPVTLFIIGLYTECSCNLNKKKLVVPMLIICCIHLILNSLRIGNMSVLITNIMFLTSREHSINSN